jgi:hypothetical protein
MLNHARYFFLCKYDFYLRDLAIWNLRIFKCIFERKIFVFFLKIKLVYLILEKHFACRSQFQILNMRGKEYTRGQKIIAK